MKYRIVIEDTASSLGDAVSGLLELGWRPQGGVAVVNYTYENERKGYTESEWVWAQAMVLDDEVKP